jgi:hypothetical protein
VNGFRCVIVLMTLCASGVAPTTAFADEYLNRSLSRRERNFETLVILPTQVTVVQTGFRGGREMFKEAADLETELTTLVEWAIRHKNPGLLPVLLKTGDTRNDVNDGYLVSDLQARFDRLLPAIVDDPGRIRRGGYTMTDAVASLAPDRSEPLLVFTRLIGSDATLLSSFVLGFREGVKLAVAMVDGVSGEVLFATLHTLRQTNVSTASAGFNSVLGGALFRLKRAMKRLPVDNPPATAISQWSVTHAHNVGLPCEGWLYQTTSSVGFRSVSDIEHRWEVKRQDIKSIEDNVTRGFHITLADGRHFNFLPSGIKSDRLVALLNAR